MSLSAVALNCSLKGGSEPSSTEKLLAELVGAIAENGVETSEPIRIRDLSILPGVKSDEGAGDDWPDVRLRILAADIVVLGTPIWVGHPSSLAQRVLERMNAFLGEEDEQGRRITFDRVALVAVVGNEDGAHHVAAELMQALVEVGFSIPAGGYTYWNGPAMGKTNYVDLDEPYEPTRRTTLVAAANAAHLARVLAGSAYPLTS